MSDSTITGDGVEVKILLSRVLIPFDLPDWVGMLGCSHCRHINWFVVALDPDIEYHDGTVVKTDSEEGWVVRMEVKAHDTCLSLELIFRPYWVLDCVATNQTGALFKEIV